MSGLSPEKPVLEVTTIYEDTVLTIARVALNGVNRPVINHGSTTTYRVLYGTGIMEVNGTPTELNAGVFVTVPAGTPYKDAGHLVMEAISIPPFNPETVEYLD